MAFGFPNPFGGSSDKDKNQSPKTESSFQPDQASTSTSPSSSIFPLSQGLTSSSSTSSVDIKNKVQTAVTTQSNVANAKALISKINENCFDHCVPSPAASLSSKEQTCLSACMEKYIDAWNVVSRTHIARLQREGAQISGAAAGGAGQSGLF